MTFIYLVSLVESNKFGLLLRILAQFIVVKIIYASYKKGGVSLCL